MTVVTETEVPVVSGPNIAIRVDYSDQTAFFDPSKNVDTVTVIGCGGIGATLLPSLVTMGFSKYTLWDHDLVEARNVASQMLYKPGDVFKSKVETCREYLYAYGAQDVEVHDAFLTEDDYLEGIVIAAVDTMAGRKIVRNAVKRNYEEHGNIALFMDGRIGGPNWHLFTVEPFDGDWYDTPEILFDDDKALPLPCGQRAYTPPAGFLANVIAQQLAAFSRNARMYKQVFGNTEVLSFFKFGPIGG